MEEVVVGIDGIEPNYLIVIDRPKNALDTLEVWVEAKPALWALGPDAAQRVEQQVAYNLKETLGLSAAIRVQQPNAIPRSEGKARRVVDKRDLKT